MASRYFEQIRTDAPQVDDQTWSDLELPALFRLMDTSVSPIGSQSLFAWLRTYVGDPRERERRLHAYRVLTEDLALRERIQLSLQPLQGDSVALLVDLLMRHEGGAPHHTAVRAWSGLCLSLAGAVVLGWVNPSVLIMMVMINAFVIYRTYPQLYRDMEALKHCRSLVVVAGSLGRLRGPEVLSELAELSRGGPERAQLRRRLRLFSWSSSPLFIFMANLLNFLVLFERLVLSLTLDAVRAQRTELLKLYEAVGSLEALICIASFLAQPRFERHCPASISPEPLIDLCEGYHPLLADPVPSTVRLQGRSALISGSNMAGKTTFIKMVGLNILLARTLGVCLATRATVPHAVVHANIHAEHSVVSGRSRYFSEVGRVLSFLKAAEGPAPVVFLLDELFSGTNTQERVAAACAVLKALGQRAQVLATTHDVELQEPLSPWYEMLSFVEDPALPQLFDYRLRGGASQVGNAIRLLARLGFPEAIVREALERLGETQGAEAGEAKDRVSHPEATDTSCAAPRS